MFVSASTPVCPWLVQPGIDGRSAMNMPPLLFGREQSVPLVRRIETVVRFNAEFVSSKTSFAITPGRCLYHVGPFESSPCAVADVQHFDPLLLFQHKVYHAVNM